MVLSGEVLTELLFASAVVFLALRHGWDLEQFLSGLSCPSPTLGQNTDLLSMWETLPWLCESTCGFWVTEKGVFCPTSHRITENMRFIVWGYPSWKVAHTGCMHCRCSGCSNFFRSLVCVTFSSCLSFDHHQNRKKGLAFFIFYCCCCDFFFILMTIVIWYLQLSKYHTVCCR